MAFPYGVGDYGERPYGFDPAVEVSAVITISIALAASTRNIINASAALVADFAMRGYAVAVKSASSSFSASVSFSANPYGGPFWVDDTPHNADWTPIPDDGEWVDAQTDDTIWTPIPAQQGF